MGSTLALNLFHFIDLARRFGIDDNTTKFRARRDKDSNKMQKSERELTVNVDSSRQDTVTTLANVLDRGSL